jgi:hypothetical protein
MVTVALNFQIIVGTDGAVTLCRIDFWGHKSTSVIDDQGLQTLRDDAVARVTAGASAGVFGRSSHFTLGFWRTETAILVAVIDRSAPHTIAIISWVACACAFCRSSMIASSIQRAAAIFRERLLPGTRID